MEKILHIGLPENAWSDFLRKETEKALPFPAVFLSMPEEQLHPALLRGDLDLAAQALHLQPLALPEGIANAALLSRMAPCSHLLIHPEARGKKAFQLAEGARAATPHPWQMVQMRDFRPDLQWIPWNGEPGWHIRTLRCRQLDALMLTAPEADEVVKDIPDLVRLEINPRECCPVPGLGALVLQCSAADKTLGKQLRFAHNSEIAEATNAERKLLRLLGGSSSIPLGAYCERDPMGIVHLWAAWPAGAERPLVRLRYSSGTAFEIAEQLLSMAQ